MSTSKIEKFIVACKWQFRWCVVATAYKSAFKELGEALAMFYQGLFWSLWLVVCIQFILVYWLAYPILAMFKMQDSVCIKLKQMYSKEESK